jgi:hypothetical protein
MIEELFCCYGLVYKLINRVLEDVISAQKGGDSNPIPSERVGLPESLLEHRKFMSEVQNEIDQRGLRIE